MPSLREQVETAVLEIMPDWGMSGDDGIAMASEVTEVMFRTMAGIRPCVTCGKGLGPAKVAKGYVQCYDCRKRGYPATP